VIRDLLDEAGDKMRHAVEHVGGEFATVRTGRANPNLLHRIVVDYYGTATPLQQLASFSVPEPRMLVVQAYDRSSLGAIEKAIRSSDLGLNPANDGAVLRLVFPNLTEERRKELIRLVRHMAEEGRVAIRNVRRHTKEGVEDMHGDISDDDIRRAEKDLQDLTDRNIGEVDRLLASKEHELLEV